MKVLELHYAMIQFSIGGMLGFYRLQELSYLTPVMREFEEKIIEKKKNEIKAQITCQN